MEQLASLMFHGQGCDILVFSEATPDKNSRINFEVFWAIQYICSYSAKCFETHLMVQMDNHLKHSAEKKQIVKRNGMLCSGHVNHLT